MLKDLRRKMSDAKVIEEPDCALEIEGFDYLNKLNTFADGDFFRAGFKFDDGMLCN